MSPHEATEAVIRALAIELRVDDQAVRVAGSLRADLGMDSITAANVIFALEDEFACELDLDGVKRLDTVADLAGLLGRATKVLGN